MIGPVGYLFGSYQRAARLESQILFAPRCLAISGSATTDLDMSQSGLHWAQHLHTKEAIRISVPLAITTSIPSIDHWQG